MGTGKKKVLFVLTVDTEEEWDWKTEFPQISPNVSNIQTLPQFSEFCHQFGIKPTYFVDYPVVDNLDSKKIIQSLIDSSDCEIGAHLHPWCNPPIQESNSEFDSHVINLPDEVILEKLSVLLTKLNSSFETEIQTFRTGRWGIDGSLLKILADNGITTDSSVYPYYQNEYFSCEGAPTEPYWPDISDPLKVGTQRDIYEFPVSVGFNYANYKNSNGIYKIANSSIGKKFKLVGLLNTLGLLKKLYLNPELTSGPDLVKLIKTLLNRQSPVIHMNLHSSSLPEFPFKNTNYSGKQLYDNMTMALEYLTSNANVEFCTLSQASEILKND